MMTEEKVVKSVEDLEKEVANIRDARNCWIGLFFTLLFIVGFVFSCLKCDRDEKLVGIQKARCLGNRIQILVEDAPELEEVSWFNTGAPCGK